MLDRRVEWFTLHEGEYVPLPPDERGAIGSRVFPGLRLAVPALLASDLAAVLAEQRATIGTPEHRRFAESLASRSPREKRQV